MHDLLGELKHSKRESVVFLWATCHYRNRRRRPSGVHYSTVDPCATVREAKFCRRLDLCVFDAWMVTSLGSETRP